MLQDRIATQAFDSLHARCLVLDDGITRLAIVICDSLMLPTDLVDEVKRRAWEASGIPAAQILIAATHTHSAPTVTPIFQSEPDMVYRQYLIAQIVASITQAQRNLAAAQIGWTVTRNPMQTFCRLWIMRKPLSDPFGRTTDRILMHPGYENPDGIEPSGPNDPTLTLVAVRTPGGRPLALLANYTMHYAQDEPCLSADYFGRFADKMTALIGSGDPQTPFVAMMSNGAQGDAHCFDYRKAKQDRTRDSVAESLAQTAFEAWKKIEYKSDISLAARLTTVKCAVRRPEDSEVLAARLIVDRAKGRPLNGNQEIYARETVLLNDYPRTVEVPVQTLRIGALGIVALPVEAYTITGLQIKRRSPLKPTFVIDLANGYNGYMPPPEHHLLGGYSTWRARSSYLPENAATRVVNASIRMLREMAIAPPPPDPPQPSPYIEAVLESKPIAYWPLNDITGPRAHDATDHGNHGIYEPKMLYFLEGPWTANFPGFAGRARAVYFFQQRIAAQISSLHKVYSAELWFCNRRAFNDKTLAGYLFSRGGDGNMGDNLGIGGNGDSPTRLFFLNGNSRDGVSTGKTDIVMGRWYHVALVREGDAVRAYLNGNLEFTTTAAEDTSGATAIYVGGHSANVSNFEGKICHVAIFDRVLGADEVTARYAVATKRT
jgi:hypothetical protein